MALSSLILGKGELVVIQSTSLLGITGVNTGISFGIIQLVNQLSDSFTSGQSVWFNVDKAIAFMVISGQIFYKVNEADITATEPVS